MTIYSYAFAQVWTWILTAIIMKIHSYAYAQLITEHRPAYLTFMIYNAQRGKLHRRKGLSTRCKFSAGGELLKHSSADGRVARGAPFDIWDAGGGDFSGRQRTGLGFWGICG